MDYPGVGPELVALQESGRATFVAISDKEALEAFERLSQLEGIIPAFESAHALALAIHSSQDHPPGSSLVVCLSGRGDKDLDQYWQIKGLA